MRNLIVGLQDYWRAQRLLLRKGLWTAFLVPGILSLLTLTIAVAALILDWGLAMIPIIGGLIAIAWMAFTQLFLAGLGFCDPPMERRKKSIRETIAHAWRHRYRRGEVTPSTWSEAQSPVTPYSHDQRG